MNAILIADCIAKRFGDRRVLRSATLRAVPGELRVLVGRNGSGKSTLLEVAAGWLAPDSGSIHFAGRAYTAAHRHVLASRGLFFLRDHDLLSPALTVRRQIPIPIASWRIGSLSGQAAPSSRPRFLLAGFRR